MKSIMKTVAGLAVAATLALGMFSCSNGSNDDSVSTKETVATPVFSVAAGEVASGTSVTITCSTEGAKIYYTTDGSAPTAASTEYTAAISVTEAVTIKAIAVKDGMNDSAVASVNYTIKVTVATPAFSDASGVVNSGTKVTITCATEGAKIYYTTDGSEPTASNTEYTAEINVTAAVTIKAIAVKEGIDNSAVASVTYTITPEGFAKVTGVQIKGTETWTPKSDVFVSGRQLTIPALIVCDHEVTRGEFNTVMGTDPSTADAYDKDDNKLEGDAVLNNPVNNLNWYVAIAYCNKLSIAEGLTPCYSVEGITDWKNLAYSSIPKDPATEWNAATCDFKVSGYRLPTEAEWEWLARGGENYTYAGSETIDDVAWYYVETDEEDDYDLEDKGTREVKTKQKNGYDLYDMSGNVYEWCWDWNGTISSTSAADGGVAVGSYPMRVMRGGAWSYYYEYCTVSDRGAGSPTYSGDNTGFRVVRNAN